MKTTNVKIQIIDQNGQPYEGAIVKARLEKPFFYQGIYINNYEYREFSNSLGVVELDLVPSTYDSSGENFYTVEIVYDTVIIKKVIVPESDKTLYLDELEEYKYPYERIDFVGDCDTRF